MRVYIYGYRAIYIEINERQVGELLESRVKSVICVYITPLELSSFHREKFGKYINRKNDGAYIV